MANPAAKENHTMVHPNVDFLRKGFFENRLDFLGSGVFFGKAKALGDTGDVGVHRNRRDPKAFPTNHVGGFNPNPWQAAEIFFVARHLSVKTFYQDLG